MQARPFVLNTTAGTFAALDYGGTGRDCILVHGTGHNAEAWRALTPHLTRDLRMVAFDLRGHGGTAQDSTDPEQYRRDVGAIANALNMPAPLLVGHSTGAYAVAAYVAAGGPASGLVCIDGFVLDSKATVCGKPPQPLDRHMLFDMFRYGWNATTAERDAYIDRVVAAAPDDRFNTGVGEDLLRPVFLRSFAEAGQDRWLKRPTFEELARVSVPNCAASVGPWRETYDAIRLPMLLIWARHGLYAGRFAEVEAVATARAGRSLATIDGSHNLPLQKPERVAAAMLRHLPGTR